MTTYRTWDPFREFEALQRELNRVFGYGPVGRPGRRTAFLPGEGARLYPLLNLSVDDNNVYIEALAPGLDPESVNVEVVKDQLTISGEKPGLSGVKPESVHRTERSAGKFVRTVTLPVEVEIDKAEADYSNGLLRIRLPKAEEVKPKRISVSVN